MQRHQDYVLRSVEERGIRYIQLWFTDVLGIRRGFSITPAELENALEDGMTFDGSAVDGFSRVQEADVLALPDARTFQILPWRTDDVPVARMFCDVVHHDGSAFAGDPRQVLRRQLEKARELGFTFFAAPELEYFYFGGADPRQPIVTLDRGSYFEMTVNDIGSELRRKTVLTLEDMGIPVEYSQHEDAPSQHEIDLRHTDALSMADTVMTARLIVKEIAQEKGVHATFMPKPLAGVQGSGMHTHFSLFRGDENAFSDEGDPDGLSATAKGFIAGVLTHAREMTAVTNQWVNSYKRLVTGYEAPTAVAWARNNRSAIVNVPHPKKGRVEATRIEYRAPDPSCNPYLAFAVVLAAGMQGIEKGYELPEPATQNLYELSAADRTATGLSALPGSLAEAVDLMEGSDLMADALGAHVFEWFLRNKRDEWAAYRTQVTQFELDRYLPTL
ncbi:MAG TPA: glutamine synthetase family protein [Acidimicrobiales bacterium]|nr:glutamine synthetase family protein [Acidimicrobiales bacterium]